jgi:hypothetical protein
LKNSYIGGYRLGLLKVRELVLGIDLLILVPKYLPKFLFELIVVIEYLLYKYLLFLIDIYNVVLKDRLELLYSLFYKS